MMLLVFSSAVVFPLPVLCDPETPGDTVIAEETPQDAVIAEEPPQDVVIVEETPQDIVIVERRPFRSFVRRDMAERTAKLAADLAAWEQAARLLAKEPDLHFINTDNIPPPSLDGLARMLFSTRVEALGAEGFPPHQQAIVKISLLPPENLRRALVDALARQDLLELYAQVTASQKSLLERYDHFSARLLPLNPITDGGQAENHILTSIVNELIALDLYIELLPEYSHNWTAQEKARPQLLRAERLAPDNPLILTALAEIFLHMDRPASALEYVERALNQTPDFAHAHDVKGAILLRKRLPSLAAESFSKAIALAPRNPIYYVHRASAYLVLEEENNMCRDFRSACGLGDCDGLQWAKSVGRCAVEQ
jgi:tetratricopeptide (TPR) repeat protein